MTELAPLRPKTYTCLTEDNNEHKKVKVQKNCHKKKLNLNIVNNLCR